MAERGSQSHIVIGTAGHIDHGKTALVAALTGIDTDRLEEEKRRGISIDIGFAHLGNLEFIDVPGHERFVKNMLAGASGIDVVMLVIAAGESIKPQTREHFEICRLLGIRHGVIALTKSDLVDADLLELTRMEIEEFVRGSFLENAPIVAASTVTRSGLDELRGALQHIATMVRAKDASRYFRLPIDRSFSMRGHGSVVTGTLIAGTLAMQDEVELYPTSKRARIRGLQVHGAQVERARAGERTAVNLAGVEAAEIHRGMVLAPPGVLRATQQVDCAVELIAGVPPLKHGAPVHFHAGTSEVEAEARTISPSHTRFLLREPLLLLPGDRFIIRKFSPVVTIGGGVILDIDAPTRVRKPKLEDRLNKLEHASPTERVALLVAESKFGMSAAELIARTGFRRSEFGEAEWFTDSEWEARKVASIRSVLAQFHRANPLQLGLAKEELRSRELAGAPPHLLDTLLTGVKDIAVEGDVVRLASHRVALKHDEDEALSKIEELFRHAGLAVPSTSEVLAKSGVEPARAKTLLQILMRNRKLVRVSEELIFHSTALDQLRALLATHKGQRFSVPDFKEWTGVSRKYAIPLLEFLDRERVTRREGESRIVT